MMLARSLLVTGTGFWSLVAASRAFSKRQADYDWASQASSPTLQWSPCYDGFECARLEVPLDYSKPVPGDIFKLAVVKLPAQDGYPYQGQFWMFQAYEGNVDFILTAASAFQSSPGLEGFDFMTFDYRGSSHSTPALTCFSDQASQNAYADQIHHGTQLGEYNATFPPTTQNIRDNINQVEAVMKQFGAGCQEYFGKYLPYMGSPDAARDLNNIVSQFPASTFKYMWHFSYATLFGTTYAAMYPNGFDRMLLDGQVDAVKVYQGGDNDRTSIEDAAVGEQIFYDSCAAAPQCHANDTLGTCNGCYFWAPTAKAVKARYDALKAKYYAKPFQSNPPSPVCGTCTTTHFEIATSLGDALQYPSDPIDFATIMSLRLLELETGYAFPGGAIEYLASSFTSQQVFSPMTITQRCLDQGGTSAVYAQGVDAFAAYLAQLNATSSQIGPLVAAQELWCAAWPAAVALKNPFNIRWHNIQTKGLMLFLSNVADPVQSFSNTQAMWARFAKAGLLVDNAAGNTDLFSGFSVCQVDYEVAFMNGTLPPYLAFCNDWVAGPFGIGYQKDYRNQRETP